MVPIIPRGNATELIIMGNKSAKGADLKEIVTENVRSIDGRNNLIVNITEVILIDETLGMFETFNTVTCSSNIRVTTNGHESRVFRQFIKETPKCTNIGVNEVIADKANIVALSNTRCGAKAEIVRVPSVTSLPDISHQCTSEA